MVYCAAIPMSGRQGAALNTSTCSRFTSVPTKNMVAAKAGCSAGETQSTASGLRRATAVPTSTGASAAGRVFGRAASTQDYDLLSRRIDAGICAQRAQESFAVGILTDQAIAVDAIRSFQVGDTDDA